MDTKTINYVALGCAKNQIDAEKMLGSLTSAGYVLVGPEDHADATIINTCGFIEDARNEAVAHIQWALEQKQEGKVRFVIVAGCLAQLWGEECFEKISGDIDAVVRLDRRDKLVNILDELIAGSVGSGQVHGVEKWSGVSNDHARMRLTDRSWAYLRISEGCNRWCSYCTIPAIRGEFRSKGKDEIIAEAKELIADGAIEINLIGQETSLWGSDIEGSGGLASLLRELNELDGLLWLRIMYTHPASLSDEIIDAIAECSRVVPYIDLPLQHINDRILSLMNRRVDRKHVEQLIQKLRDRIPDVIVRTTMIVGFPSETDSEFEEMVEFVKTTRFDMLGAFAYSAEPGTKAAELEGHIDEEVKEKRLDELMLAQQEIAFEKAREQVGKEFDCLLVNYIYEDDLEELGLDKEFQWFEGRSALQGPEVDSATWVGIDDADEIVPGMIVEVKVIDSIDYDLVAVPTGKG